MGNLAKIREISVRYNVSARTRRYYEKMIIRIPTFRAVTSEAMATECPKRGSK